MNASLHCLCSAARCVQESVIAGAFELHQSFKSLRTILLTFISALLKPSGSESDHCICVLDLDHATYSCSLILCVPIFAIYGSNRAIEMKITSEGTQLSAVVPDVVESDRFHVECTQIPLFVFARHKTFLTNFTDSQPSCFSPPKTRWPSPLSLSPLVSLW